MEGPPVLGHAVASSVVLIGQAPGTKEIGVGRPFAWTAGKTLFGWFAGIGLEEQTFRTRVYMTAICRCFPGKNRGGGDRVPSRKEVANCARWWRGELRLLRPRLILPVGKLAISQLIDTRRLDDVVGKRWDYEYPDGETADLIPLPHPSGASTWFRTEPGKTLLPQALALIESHPTWRELCVPAPHSKAAIKCRFPPSRSNS
jgi:uracil-DNA glycosylase